MKQNSLLAVKPKNGSSLKFIINTSLGQADVLTSSGELLMKGIGVLGSLEKLSTYICPKIIQVGKKNYLSVEERLLGGGCCCSKEAPPTQNVQNLKIELHEKQVRIEQLYLELKELKQNSEQGRRIEDDYRTAKQEISRLNTFSSENEKLAEKLKLRVESLNSEKELVEKRLKELEEINQKLVCENQELKDTGTLVSELESEKQELHQKNLVIEAKLFELHSGSQENKLDEKLLKEKHVRLLAACYRKHDFCRLLQSFNIWKKVERVFEESTQDTEFKEAQESASMALQQEKENLMESNAIMKELKGIDQRSVKPMNPTNTFKLLEEMMDQKYKTDQKDLADKRKPRSMTEYMVEFLNRRFGIRNIAQKTLAQLIPTLRDLVTQEHPYAQFYARLLQLFHQDPVPYNLALYLVVARVKFASLVEKANKLKERLGKKSGVGSGGITHGQAAVEYAGSGGEAMLFDVLDYVYHEFVQDPEGGALMLRLIKPGNISFIDHVSFIITHKMKKAGKRPDELFKLLDKDSGGSIDAEEFIRGTKSDLELWLSDEDIKRFFFEADDSGNGELEYEEFEARINFKKYESSIKTFDYIVTKSNYLNSLIEVYNFRQLRDATELERILEEQSSEPLNYEKFSEMIGMIDSGIPPAKIQEFFIEALESSEFSDVLSKSAFIIVCVRNGIGGYGLGSFAIRELLDVMQERQYSLKVDSKSFAEPKYDSKFNRTSNFSKTNPEELEESKAERRRSLTTKHFN